MKSVLITGGSRGIGAATVRAFSAAGYAVAFTYLESREAAELLAEETGALAIRADSRREEDVHSAVKTVLDAFSRLDCLVNNAGVASFSLFTELTFDEWRRIFSVSVDGAFLYTREVLPSMIAHKQGRIINISSMWGLVGASCEVHYSAAKAALIGMTKALAKEVGPSGITVNAIAPGVIDTEMNRELSEEDLAALADEAALCRIGTPEEVAKAALFLAGEDASFITGDVLNLSGGFVI